MSVNDSLAYGKQVFNSMGFSDEIFYGVAGSLMGESGRQLNPNSFNAGDPNGGSYGMGQWHGDRRRGLETLAKATGRAANDYTVQWDWIAKELQTTEKAAFEALKKARNRHEAAKTWTNFYERPNQKYANHDLRASHADHVASTFGSGVSAGDDSGWGSTDELLMGGGGSDDLRGGTGGNQAGASSDGAGSNPMADPMGFLTGLTGMMGMGTGGQMGGDGVKGPVTAGQGLALAIGSMIGGPAGLQMAATLFGAGNTPKQLSLAEGVAMGIGGLIGGIPGSFIGQALGSAIEGLFTGQNPFAPPGTPGAIGTPSPFAQQASWGTEIEPGFWSGDTGWGGNGGGSYGGAPSVSGLPQRRPDDLNTSGGSSSSSSSSSGSYGGAPGSGGNVAGATQGSDF